MLRSDIEQEYLELLPCSVQKLVAVFGYSPKLELSLDQRLLAFQHWVACELYGERAKNSRDNIKCPFIGCASRFDNLESCLSHLTKCTWLDNAWYWCPFCMRPEQFTDSGSRTACPDKLELSHQISEPTPSSDRKGSKSRGVAVRLLKSFGSKLGIAIQTPTVEPCTSMDVVSQGRELLPGWKVMESGAAAMNRSESQPKGKADLEGHDWFLVEQQQSMNMPSEAAFHGYAPQQLPLEELEGQYTQPVELEGRRRSHEWSPMTAELPTDGQSGLPELVASSPPTIEPQSWPLASPPFSGNDSFRFLVSNSSNTPTSAGGLPSYTEISDTTGYPITPLPSTHFQRADLPSPDSLTSKYEVPKLTQVPSGLSMQGRATFSMHEALDRAALMDMSGYNLQGRNQEAQYQHLPHSVTYPDANVYHKPTSIEVQSVYPQGSTRPNRAPDQVSLWAQFPSNPDAATLRQRRQFNRRNRDLHHGLHEGQAQNVRSPPQTIDHVDERRGDQDRTTIESSAPLRFIPTHGNSTSFISPTDSIISSKRDSNGSSNISTQITSVENSPTSVGTPSIFAVNADSQMPVNPDTSPCPNCDTTFSGTFQDRRSNLNRHNKYQHGGLGKFQCQTEGCNKEYSRPDNLLKHRRAEHLDAQPLRRSNAQKGRRDI